jgi:hypothetical protein
MCKPASMVVVKGYKCVWSRHTDAHTEIRASYGIPENGIGRVTSVQIEITPPDSNWAAPFAEWAFKVDQDILPDWWDAADAEKAVRDELPSWAKARLVRCGVERDVTDGEYIVAVCGGTVNAVSGGTVNAVSGGTVNEVWGGTVNEVRGGTVNAVSGGTVNEVRGGTVNAVWGGTVNAVSGGTVNAVRGGTVNAVWGGTVNEVSGGTVNAVCGGTVNAVRGGTVNEVRGGTVSFRCQFAVKLTGVMSVVINRIGMRARCFVGTAKTRTVRGT